MDGTLRKARRVHNELVDDIDVGGGRRTVDPEAVTRIAASMQEIGLRVPISVRVDGEAQTITLVAGAHRLAAAKHLGWEWIETFRVDGDDIDARMEEIAENLHRAELTALERDEQVAEWVRLVDERNKRLSDNLSEKDIGRPGAGAQAAREIGANERSVQRAVKVASLSDEAKQAARDVGLDDNQSALLEAAKEDTPEAQVHYLQTRKPQKRADDPLNDFEAEEKQVAALMSAWNRAAPAARERFLTIVDRPVMDRNWGTK